MFMGSRVEEMSAWKHGGFAGELLVALKASAVRFTINVFYELHLIAFMNMYICKEQVHL